MKVVFFCGGLGLRLSDSFRPHSQAYGIYRFPPNSSLISDTGTLSLVWGIGVILSSNIF
jgi:hypothetical protein